MKGGAFVRRGPRSSIVAVAALFGVAGAVGAAGTSGVEGPAAAHVAADRTGRIQMNAGDQCGFVPALYPSPPYGVPRSIVLYRYDGAMVDDLRLAAPVAEISSGNSLTLSQDCRTVYVRDRDAYHAVDVVTGESRRHELRMLTTDLYSMKNGQLLTWTQVGGVRVVDVDTGETQWSHDFSPINVSTGTMSTDGKFIAFVHRPGHAELVVLRQGQSAPVLRLRLQYSYVGAIDISWDDKYVLVAGEELPAGAGMTRVFDLAGRPVAAWPGTGTRSGFIGRHDVVVCQRDGAYRSTRFGPLRFIEGVTEFVDNRFDQPIVFSPERLVCSTAFASTFSI